MPNANRILLFSLLFVMPLVAVAKLYRWVDEQGAVHYTDTLPPAQSQRGHTELRPDGLIEDQVDPAKSLEEYQRELELERLREEQQRVIEKQEQADRVLLNTYRSEDDIVMVRNGTLETIDLQIRVARLNIQRQQEKLTELRGEAGDYERTGKQVPKRLVEQMGSLEQAIHAGYSQILEREEQKVKIRERFARDIKRFRELKHLPARREPIESMDMKPVRSVLTNFVMCADKAECDSLWGDAKRYLEAHATTPIVSTGDNLVVHASPTEVGEVGLILTRIDTPDGASSLFLDVNCDKGPRAEEICRSKKATAALDGFRAAIKSTE